MDGDMLRFQNRLIDMLAKHKESLTSDNTISLRTIDENHPTKNQMPYHSLLSFFYVNYVRRPAPPE